MNHESTEIRASNPYGGRPGGGITLPPYYRPTPSIVGNNIYFPGQEKLGHDEMRISFIGSRPFPVAKHTGRHLHHGRTGQRRAVLLRFRPGLLEKHHRDAGAVPRRSTTSSSPTCTWITTPTCPISAFAPGWGAGSRCASMGRRAGLPSRHQAHDRRDEEDDPLAHGVFQRVPDRRRLRSRGQRVRLEG